MAQRPSEAGFALIEVIVSCAVLAIVAMAVLSGIDAASNSSAREKARAVAAALAEQDQERMRGLTVDELASLTGPKACEDDAMLCDTRTVDGVDYTIRSEAKWIADDEGGTPSCGNSSKNTEYLHISTTVTSSIVGRNIDPVKLDSIVAPSVAWSSTHGVLGVKVVDRNAVGVPGVLVGATTPGHTEPSKATDANGCVIFKLVPVGTYSITLDKPGYVDVDGNRTGGGSHKVSPGVISFKTLEYDLATTADPVQILTNVPGASTRVASKWSAVSARNAKRLSKLWTVTNANRVSSFEVADLYPFKDSAYGFFTGTCTSQHPELAGISNYYATHPGALQMDPTVSLTRPVEVLQPPLRLRIVRDRDGSTFNTSNLRVYARPVDCDEGRVDLTFRTWPGGAWGTAPDSGSGRNNNWVVQADATGFDPGLPYGDWTICVHDTNTGRSDRYQSFPYSNKRSGGQDSTMRNDAHGWTRTSCT